MRGRRCHPRRYGILDATIREAWAGAPDRLFTPDDLRGSYTSLARAVIECGWPDAEEMRGKTLFTLLIVRHGYQYAALDSGATCPSQADVLATPHDIRWAEWDVPDCNTPCTAPPGCAGGEMPCCLKPIEPYTEDGTGPRPALLGRPIFSMGNNPYMSTADNDEHRAVSIIKMDEVEGLEMDEVALERGFLIRSRGGVIPEPSAARAEGRRESYQKERLCKRGNRGALCMMGARFLMT